jgi:hypothetical protein
VLLPGDRRSVERPRVRSGSLLGVSELSIDEVIALVERALRAELTFDQLATLWPPLPVEHPLAEVREDLEFAVEHIPGHRSGPRRGFLRRPSGEWQSDLELWKDSVEYDDLQRHLSRLRSAQDGATDV